jgi:hypothetical protein
VGMRRQVWVVFFSLWMGVAIGHLYALLCR